MLSTCSPATERVCGRNRPTSRRQSTDAQDRFGSSVALSGDALAVGAPGEDSVATGIDGDQSDNSADDSGAVYVFTRDGAGIWSQHAYIKASNTDAGDRFGNFVALSSGNTLAVGAYYEDSIATGIDGDQSDNSASEIPAPSMYLRATKPAIWSQQAYVKASNTEPAFWDERLEQFSSDNFGWSVALSR